MAEFRHQCGHDKRVKKTTQQEEHKWKRISVQDQIREIIFFLAF